MSFIRPPRHHLDRKTHGRARKRRAMAVQWAPLAPTPRDTVMTRWIDYLHKCVYEALALSTPALSVSTESVSVVDDGRCYGVPMAYELLLAQKRAQRAGVLVFAEPNEDLPRTA